MFTNAADRRGSIQLGKEHWMAGIGLGGILVIVGIVLAIVWSLWIGIIIALIGLIAFGGVARGKRDTRSSEALAGAASYDALRGGATTALISRCETAEGN